MTARGNHEAHPRHLKALFEEYCTDYVMEKDALMVAEDHGNETAIEKARTDKDKSYKRIDSVLDLHISLGGLLIEQVTDFSKYPVIEEIENDRQRIQTTES